MGSRSRRKHRRPQPKSQVPHKFAIDERVLCYEPDKNKARVLYDSKVLQTVERTDEKGKIRVEYKIHFFGWNSSWDRYVDEEFVLKDTDENRDLQKELKAKADVLIQSNTKNKKKRKKTLSELLKEATKDKSGKSGSHGTKNDDSGKSSSDGDSSDQESSDDDYSGLPMAQIILPERLKNILKQDYYNIVKNKLLVTIPANVSVICVFEGYVKFFGFRQIRGLLGRIKRGELPATPANVMAGKGTKSRNSLSQTQIKPVSLNWGLEIVNMYKRVQQAQEVMYGLRTIFDFTFNRCLLYNQEEVQYTKISTTKPRAPVIKCDKLAPRIPPPPGAIPFILNPVPPNPPKSNVSEPQTKIVKKIFCLPDGRRVCKLIRVALKPASAPESVPGPMDSATVVQTISKSTEPKDEQKSSEEKNPVSAKPVGPGSLTAETASASNIRAEHTESVEASTNDVYQPPPEPQPGPSKNHPKAGTLKVIMATEQKYTVEQRETESPCEEQSVASVNTPQVPEVKGRGRKGKKLNDVAVEKQSESHKQNTETTQIPEPNKPLEAAQASVQTRSMATFPKKIQHTIIPKTSMETLAKDVKLAGTQSGPFAAEGRDFKVPLEITDEKNKRVEQRQSDPGPGVKMVDGFKVPPPVDSLKKTRTRQTDGVNVQRTRKVVNAIFAPPESLRVHAIKTYARSRSRSANTKAGINESGTAEKEKSPKAETGGSQESTVVAPVTRRKRKMPPVGNPCKISTRSQLATAPEGLQLTIFWYNKLCAYMRDLNAWKLLPPESFKSEIEPSMVYGIVHLLRFITKLPDILSRMVLPRRKVEIIARHVNQLLQHIEICYKSDCSEVYEQATKPAVEQAKAGVVNPAATKCQGAALAKGQHVVAATKPQSAPAIKRLHVPTTKNQSGPTTKKEEDPSIKRPSTAATPLLGKKPSVKVKVKTKEAVRHQHHAGLKRLKSKRVKVLVPKKMNVPIQVGDQPATVAVAPPATQELAGNVKVAPTTPDVPNAPNPGIKSESDNRCSATGDATNPKVVPVVEQLEIKIPDKVKVKQEPISPTLHNESVADTQQKKATVKSRVSSPPAQPMVRQVRKSAAHAAFKNAHIFVNQQILTPRSSSASRKHDAKSGSRKRNVDGEHKEKNKVVNVEPLNVAQGEASAGRKVSKVMKNNPQKDSSPPAEPVQRASNNSSPGKLFKGRRFSSGVDEKSKEASPPRKRSLSGSDRKSRSSVKERGRRNTSPRSVSPTKKTPLSPRRNSFNRDGMPSKSPSKSTSPTTTIRLRSRSDERQLRSKGSLINVLSLPMHSTTTARSPGSARQKEEKSHPRRQSGGSRPSDPPETSSPSKKEADMTPTRNLRGNRK